MSQGEFDRKWFKREAREVLTNQIASLGSPAPCEWNRDQYIEYLNSVTVRGREYLDCPEYRDIGTEVIEEYAEEEWARYWESE
jgi:hypothetical protein